MDFGALPPEVNSARMYSGAGVSPLLAAAGAWNGIASELNAAASSFDAVITRLITDEWTGTASLLMAAAVQPHVAWLSYTSECAAFAATQAMASAAAFEQAYAMTVPPAEVAANRALLARLVATDTFGHNVAAIAATEARYCEMWAQDASAMYSYAASSAAAAKLNPLTDPAPVADAAGAANQAAAVAQSAAVGQAAATGPAELRGLIASGPEAVTGLAAPGAAEASNWMELLVAFDRADLWWVESLNHQRATYWDYGVGWPMGGDEEEEIETIAGAADSGIRPAPLTRSMNAGAPPVAHLGKALLVGELSVPANWPVAAPVTTERPAVEATGWTVGDKDEEPSVAPGMVAVAHGSGRGSVPRYGVKPIVMPTQGVF